MWKARDPKWLLAGAAALFALAQFIPVERTNPPEEAAMTIEANTEMPAEVLDVLNRACADCHSNRTRWPWYSRVAPVSWFVADDVRHARSHYNLSEWGKMEPKDADRTLDEMCEEVEKGAMPLASYRWMHSEAKLTEADVTAICDWAGAERERIRAAMDESGEKPEEGAPERDDGRDHQH